VAEKDPVQTETGWPSPHRGGGWGINARKGSALFGAALAITLSLLVIAALAPADSEPVFISPEELRDLMEEQADIVLIDLRDPASFEWERIPGAVNIPAERIDREMRKFRKKKIVLYCYSQGTSMAVAMNFPRYDIAILKDGIIGWEQEGLQMEDK